ncbi:MAG: glycosyltransferase [Pseudomonadota bacterium]
MAEAKRDVSEPLRVLALTSLFPSPARPDFAAFNRQQLTALAGLCRLSLVAPLPFAIALRRPGSRDPDPPPAFPLRRPVFWYLPGVKRAWHGRAYLRSAWPALRASAAALQPQVLLATWLYPDAWAGLMAARRLGLPLVVKLHGSDLLRLRQAPERLPFLGQVLAQATRVVAVSADLAAAAAELGAPRDRLRVVANGVDQALFSPGDRAAARRELGLPLEGSLLLYVGWLVAVKGPDLALEALAKVPDARLAIVGAGGMEKSLRAQAARLGLADRVIWAGAQPHQNIARWLAACDALVLPSRSEGEPNVVLEALCAGRPVAAAAVGGAPALVREGVNGDLARPEDPADLARAVAAVLGRTWDPDELRATVAGRSWPASAAALLAVLREAAEAGA